MPDDNYEKPPLVGAACALRACGDACLEPGCECECHTAPRPLAELLALQAELSEPGWRKVPAGRAAMTATESAPHRCEFPVQPPHGSFASPGPCACGKTYFTSIAEQRAAEAGLVVVDPEDLRVLMRLAQDYAGRDPLYLPPSASCRKALDRLAVAAGVKS